MWNVCPEEFPSKSQDPSLHLVQLALAGYSKLAADTLLFIENHGNTLSILQAAIDQLDLAFQENKPESRNNSAKVLLEIALNFLGMERKRAGFSDGDTSQVLGKIAQALQTWESTDARGAIPSAVHEMLGEMKMVLSGKGMVARMAEEIESALVPDDLTTTFLEASKKALQDNVYFRIVDQGFSKFGNDSATGLRWARHLGAVQVSSNPVIAARAYEEIADLWKSFEIVASAHPEWQADPERYADEIALFGTVNSLLPNILDFRPLALLSNFKDGMVSIQLNPRKARSVEGSLEDALRFHSILQEILERYDTYLSPNSPARKENARPNIVFKVSTSGLEAIGLTESLDKRGIGTNNTVTFTVSQEIRLTLVAMRGLASALKAGIPITTIYITNMEGRLEDHLREVQAAKIFAEHLKNDAQRETKVSSISQKVGAIEDLKECSSPEQQINLLSSKKYLKSLTDDWFVEALGRETLPRLKTMEEDIRMSGIYVTRKVFQLLFKPAVKPSLIKYLHEQFELSEIEASKVVSAVDLLPASKRRADDTYLVLGYPEVTNLTNTEFPDHQLKVLQKSKETGFQLAAYENSIAEAPDQSILQRLLEIPDFQRAYEMNTDLVDELAAIGIDVPMEKNGMETEEWASYGPVKKTMEEFTGAYVSFQQKLLTSVRKVSLRKQPEIPTRAIVQ